MPYPTIYLASEYAPIGGDRSLRALAQSGTLTRIAPGAYVDTAAWTRQNADERYRTVVLAASASRPFDQFSHESAAAMWRLPMLGRWPTQLHVLGETATGGRSRVGLSRHCVGLDEGATVVDGVFVTSLARTVADIARGKSFSRAVTMADHALREPVEHEWRFGTPAVSREELRQALERGGSFGLTRAQRVIEFADGKSGSPSETVSRVQFLALGLPAPILQKEFRDAEGCIYPDFYFPQWDLACEVDGASKYGASRAFQLDLTPQQILLREKDRGDRLRRMVRSVARWDSAVASDRRALAARLREHGVPV